MISPNGATLIKPGAPPQESPNGATLIKPGAPPLAEQSLNMPKPKKTTRGTDETFLKLMTVSGSSVLKLLGVPPKQA